MLNSRSLLFEDFYKFLLHLSLVRFGSVTQSCPTPCNPMNCSTLGFLVHHQLPEPTQTHVHCVGDAIQPSLPLLPPFFLLFLPSVFLSIRVFSIEMVLLIRWPKYWSCSFSIIPFKAYLGLISFRIASLVAQTVKRLSTMWETWVWSLGWEDPLENEMAIHSRTIDWKIPWTEEPGRLQTMGSQRVRHDWVTSLTLTFRIDWLDLLVVQGTLKNLLQHHS